MKTRQLLIGTAAMIVSASLLFTGCRKEKEKDTDTSGAEDNALADKSFEDMHQISNEASEGGLKSYKGTGSSDGLLSTCAVVTKDTAAKTVVVDFGPANCLCSDGRYRRGKIFISYTGKLYRDSLAHVTITTTKAGDPGSDSYFVNDHQVIGTKNVTNNGHNAAHHLNWDIVANGKVIKPNGGGTVLWQSNRNREWLSGEPTPFNWADDSYGVTGSASGTSARGVSFAVQITKQLVWKVLCAKHFVEGTLDYTPGSKPVRHVDFGYSPAPNPSGSCDNWVSVVINGTTYYKQLQ